MIVADFRNIMKLVSKLLTNLKMREMKLVSILISYIMLKNYQTHQEKSLIWMTAVIHIKDCCHSY